MKFHWPSFQFGGMRSYTNTCCCLFATRGTYGLQAPRLPALVGGPSPSGEPVTCGKGVWPLLPWYNRTNLCQREIIQFGYSMATFLSAWAQYELPFVGYLCSLPLPLLWCMPHHVILDCVIKRPNCVMYPFITNWTLLPSPSVYG